MLLSGAPFKQSITGSGTEGEENVPLLVAIRVISGKAGLWEELDR